MIIELFSCMGCGTILDQFTSIKGCPKCFTKFVKPVYPTKWVIFKWFLGHPKHVIKLILQDIREKYYEKRV